jgi:hypothetical protein
MVNVFPKTLKLVQRNKLENLTLRGFGGGWNAVETDLQMDSTYLVKVRNFRRTPGGTQKIRYGSRYFVDLSDIVSGHIVDMDYFSESLICVISTGEIVAVQGIEGSKVIIWSSAIAAELFGAPAGWSNNIASVDFVPFKQELIIHNGIDKPITISRDLNVTYLQDLATGSNVNVPIGRYGCVVSNYHCVAGIRPTDADLWANSHVYAVDDLVTNPQTLGLFVCLVAHTSPSTGTLGDDIDANPTHWAPSSLGSPTLVYISAVGTAGTFPGDPAPNDSVTIDVGAFAPQGATSIRGIAGFRANLLIHFQDQTVIVKLGTYNAAGVHEPFFPDTMPTFGLLGHRCIVPVENDLLFAGLQGMASARRNLLSVSGTLESQSLSERIEPSYRSTIGNLSDTQQLNDCFMVYDKLSHDMLLFTPSGQVFVYSFSTKLRYSAWSEFSGLHVQCGCTSFLGRLFYADGLKVFQHGNKVFEGEEFFADRVDDRTKGVWENDVSYSVGDIVRDEVAEASFVCLVGHQSPETGLFSADRVLHPNRWEIYDGIDIDFEMELPWLDSKNPMQVKFLRFIAMATKGNAKFFVSAFVDNLYKNHEQAVVFGPAVSMEFIGNEAVGFGYEGSTLDPTDTGPYGGGRRSGDPRLFKFPCKFKILKIRIHGMRAGDLELVNMSFLFSRGKYKR